MMHFLCHPVFCVGGLSQISSGPAGVWGVNSNGNIYYRLGTYGDYGSHGSLWKQVDDIFNDFGVDLLKEQSD